MLGCIAFHFLVLDLVDRWFGRLLACISCEGVKMGGTGHLRLTL
jgi:hypothetical protein